MKKKIIISIPVIVILGYVLYKGSLLLYFRDLSHSLDLEEVNIKERKVEVDKSLANTKKDNMNIFIPDELVENGSRQGYYIFIPKSEIGKQYTTSIFIAKDRSCLERLYDEDKRIQTVGYEKLMKKNNIISDNDLIKYYFAHENKSNIFTSSNEIKLRYLSKVCVKESTITDDVEDRNFYLLGDLEGTLYLENDREYRIRVYNKNKNEYYSIYISKSVNSDDYVDIISNDVFDKIIKSIYFDNE